MKPSYVMAAQLKSHMIASATDTFLQHVNVRKRKYVRDESFSRMESYGKIPIHTVFSCR